MKRKLKLKVCSKYKLAHIICTHKHTRIHTQMCTRTDDEKKDESEKLNEEGAKAKEREGAEGGGAEGGGAEGGMHTLESHLGPSLN